MKPAFFTAGDVARTLGSGRSTERARQVIDQYEKAGLIAPLRDSHGRRLLSPEDADRVRQLWFEGKAGR